MLPATEEISRVQEALKKNDCSSPGPPQERASKSRLLSMVEALQGLEGREGQGGLPAGCEERDPEHQCELQQRDRDAQGPPR